jgi:hypothetical protein
MSEHQIRALNLDLPATVSNYEETEDGLTVRNVKLLAEGTWTDSAVQTPLYYPADVLELYATNWVDSTFWARHSGGAPRNVVTDQLGEVLNQHYDPQEKAVMGDVFYDYSTTTGRDGGKKALKAAKKGKPPAVSVEWGGREVYNPDTRQYEALEMVYVGLAQVTRGACTKCKLPKAMSAEERQVEMNAMEADEIKKMLADFGAELKASIVGDVDAKLAAFAPKPDGELSAALDSTKQELAAVTERLKKLEMTPEPRTVIEAKPELEASVAQKLPRIRKGSIECE